MALIVFLRDGVWGRDGVKPGQKRQQQKTFIANFCDDFKQRNHKGLCIEGATASASRCWKRE